MKRQILIISSLIIFIILSFASYYFLIRHYVPKWSTRGQIGDTFGFLNALFSAVAFGGVIYTIIQQGEIIKQNKIDSENSTKQFTTSVNQFEQQQTIQSLVTLITIYERKLLEYRNEHEGRLASETEKKLVDLTKKLELLITK